MLAHDGQTYEKLISLEESSDDSSPAADPLTSLTSGPSFEQDITRLKHDSSAKFQRKWNEILAKYAAIDDNAESDEIDLHTGRITKDNGHIRSLAEDGQMINGIRLHDSIWAGNYDYERVMREEERLEKRVRKHKHKIRDRLKSEDKFYNSSPITTSDSDILEDNLLLIGLPIRMNSSPLKRKVLPFGYLLSSPVKRTHTMNSSPERSHSGEYRGEEDYRGEEYHRKGSYDEDYVLQTREDYFGGENSRLSAEVCDLHGHVSVSLFCCAFLHCTFTSESRSVYRDHLLRSHAPELCRIGYPVEARGTGDVHVLELSFLKLNLHFPIEVPAPEKCYKCRRNMPAGKCSKMFLSADQLAQHQSDPRKCTTRRQILLCPILGCDLRAAKYSEWRDHVNSHRRVTVVSDRAKAMDSVDEFFSDTSSLVFSDEEEEKKEEEKKEDEEIIEDEHSAPRLERKVEIPATRNGSNTEEPKRQETGYSSYIDVWQARTTPLSFDILTDEDSDH